MQEQEKISSYQGCCMTKETIATIVKFFIRLKFHPEFRTDTK